MKGGNEASTDTGPDRLPHGTQGSQLGGLSREEKREWGWSSQKGWDVQNVVWVCEPTGGFFVPEGIPGQGKLGDPNRSFPWFGTDHWRGGGRDIRTQ